MSITQPTITTSNLISHFSDFVKFGERWINSNTISHVRVRKSDYSGWRVLIKTSNTYHPYIVSHKYDTKWEAEHRMHVFMTATQDFNIKYEQGK